MTTIYTLRPDTHAAEWYRLIDATWGDYDATLELAMIWEEAFEDVAASGQPTTDENIAAVALLIVHGTREA